MFPPRVKKQLVDVHGQAPRANAKSAEKAVQPIGPTPRLEKPTYYSKYMNVRLTHQVVVRPVRGIVVDDEEPADSQTAIVREKGRQPKGLITALRKHADLARRAGVSSVSA